MTEQRSEELTCHAGLEPLLALPVVCASISTAESDPPNERDGEYEAFDRHADGGSNSPSSNPTSPFDSERAYRYCKAVAQDPFKPCSHYPAVAGMSTKTALPIRKSLVNRGWIRERTVNSGGRGRARILLEPTPQGIDAVARHEAMGANL